MHFFLEISSDKLDTELCKEVYLKYFDCSVDVILLSTSLLWSSWEWSEYL